MVHQNVFSHMPALNFIDAEKIIRSGDIILCSGNSRISCFIRDATNSIFSHVGLLLKMPVTGQWLVLESVESLGVRCVTLLYGYVRNYQDTKKGYDGKVLIARHQDFHEKDHYIKSLYKKAFELTGDKYSTEDIFKIAARIALNKIGIHESGLIKENDHYICSEYLYACFKAADIHLPYNELGFISPADIAGHEKIHPVCQLAMHEILPTPAETQQSQPIHLE